jgi:protein-S-isoprenylcysteine O-methyltransferase Ste14
MNRELFIILIIIGFLTHAIRSVYEILKHKEIIKPNRTTFVIVFTNMFLLWVSWFVLCSLKIYRIAVPSIVRISGLLLFVSGLVIFLTGLITIKTLESYEGDLITTGIYSKLRHPMYLGFILWLAGIPLFSGSLWLLILSLLFTANILFWRSLEEKELEKRFQSYNEYKKKTIF